MKSYLLILNFLFTMPLLAQQYNIPVSVIAGSGGKYIGNNFTLNGTAGQPAIGTTIGSSFMLIAGFWHSQLIITDVEGEPESNLPTEYKLEQNYPNPFNPSTIIKYDIPKESFVTLKIYDILGREIKTLVNEDKPAGRYSVTFNAGNLASGTYIYRILAGSFIQTKKLALLK